MRIDVPTVNLLKVQSETERLLRVVAGTSGKIRILNDISPVYRFFEGNGGYFTKFRDLLENAVMVEADNSYYFLLGIEAQSKPDPLMAARVFLYDAMAIMQQCIDAVNRKLGDVSVISRKQWMKSFPNGFAIKPIKTIIVYTGLESWFGQLSLLEMMEDKATVEKLGKTDAYKEKIEIISVAHLERETAMEIGGQWGTLSRLLSASRTGTPKSEDFKLEVLGKNAQQIYNNTCGVHTFPEEEEVMVGNVLERIERENQAIGYSKGELNGEVRGLQQGRFASVQNLMETKGFSAEEAMGALRIPSSDRAACLKYLGL